ncbi:MAG: methyltransferase domain-containing protein [Polyangiaceae bacterium]|nr:methyltransferase domain-containing protein [Polyangiaceae bacterium]
MSHDRERWDARHARAGFDERPPNAVVMDLAAGQRQGRALDLASGSGRHALALADRGLEVEAWDVSPVGLGLCAARARARGLSVVTRVVDLSEPLPLAVFDLVLMVDFLERRCWPRLPGLLAPDGLLVISTFTVDWPEPHPSRRFRLARGELRQAFPELSPLHYEEAGGRASIALKKAPA